MAEFKVELTSGKSIVIEDERSLAGLAEELCNHGFVQAVRIDKGGYQASNRTEVALFERAIVCIEPT
jgi:hypothetical protein